LNTVGKVAGLLQNFVAVNLTKLYFVRVCGLRIPSAGSFGAAGGGDVGLVEVGMMSAAGGNLSLVSGGPETQWRSGFN